jgi:hypothetical protein
LIRWKEGGKIMSIQNVIIKELQSVAFNLFLCDIFCNSSFRM